MRTLIRSAELTARMGGFEPKIVLIPDMADDRIVCERITEGDLGPHMRRMTFYAMSPKTYYKSENEVRSRFGVRPTWSITALDVQNRRLIVPIKGHDGLHEWEIEL